MGKLRLSLLGRPRVTHDGTPLTGWALQKSLALLAYLAVTGRPHSRGALAGLLWRDCTEANARSNLRKVVAELRRRVPSHLTITRADVAFDRASAYWLDVEAFERDIGRALALRQSPVPPAEAECLANAIELYGDRFLADLAVHSAPDFEEWVLLEQGHLLNLALRALHTLADHHEAHSEPARAIAYLNRLLELEPAQEEAHRHKMALLVHCGERSAALRQYEALRQAMQALDAELDAQTTALYHQIRAGTGLLGHFGATRHSPQPPLTLLIGREAELSEIQAILRDPSCQLLTLVGPGGIGKTHLAMEVAAGILFGGGQSSGETRRFEDGVCVVRLGSVPAAEGLVPGISQALGLPLSEGSHAQQQLLDHLRGKRLLLVLDGFEHLLAGASLLLDFLLAAPGLTVLVTSQVRLGLQAEQLLPLAGLPCTGIPLDEPETLASMPAVQLYLSRARRILPGFQASAVDLRAIVRICRLVDGLPLAISLAAGWTGMLSPAQIAAELEEKSHRGLGFLKAHSQDLPARQRSMEAVFDHSWGLLAAREQRVLTGLSVFRGTFTLDAARQAAGASLGELRKLMDRSLLQQTTVGRYGLHELLRQYAGERLEERSSAARAARDGHSAYYSAAVERWWEDLQGPRHQQALAEMGLESGNLHAAWSWAVERGHVALLDQAMEGLFYFHKWSGRYEEGEKLCRRAAEGHDRTGEPVLEGSPNPPEVSPPERLRVQARALAWQGVFSHRLGRSEQARALLKRSLDMLDELAWTAPDGAHCPPEDIQRGRAFALWRLGNLASELDRPAALRLYRHSLALYRALQDPWGTASVLEALGRTATFSEERDVAQHAFVESLELRQEQGDDLGRYRLLGLGMATAAYDSQVEMEQSEEQVTTSSALHHVSLAMGVGQFARAKSLLARHRSTDESPGTYGHADLLDLLGAFNQMHLGHYQRARAQTMACLARFRETGYCLGIERCCSYLGVAALATEAYAEARQWLQESVSLCREIRQWGHLSQALALSALVDRGLGDLRQARQHLCEALCVATDVRDHESFAFQMIAVSAAALLLADEGQLERAVELYAVASRYPVVANSQLMDDLAGRYIASIIAQLPQHAAAAAQALGRARDLKPTVVGFLAELGGIDPEAAQRLPDGMQQSSFPTAWDGRVHWAEDKPPIP
jgi:predicted ATPase/DNA-binding SARP family transcriptional activator